MRYEMPGPDSSIVRAFGMNPNVVGSSPPRSEKFPVSKLRHFHKSTPSWIEHECCYAHRVGILYVCLQKNICIIQWHVYRLWWAHVNCSSDSGKGGPLLRFIRALFCLTVCNCGTHQWKSLDIWTDTVLHQTYLILHNISVMLHGFECQWFGASSVYLRQGKVNSSHSPLGHVITYVCLRYLLLPWQFWFHNMIFKISYMWLS